MVGRLDRGRTGFYMRPAFWACFCMLWGAGVARAEKDSATGAQLPDGAEKVGENRYRVREDFEGTLKYYRSVYPVGTHPRRMIVNQPGIKAVHIENPSGRNFAGLNVYQTNDEVRIYIVPLEKVAKKRPEKKK